jgi:hypothetical protein
MEKMVFLDEFKPIKDPKTVYDQRTIIVTNKCISGALKQMKKWIFGWYLICGEASNGMEIYGYLEIVKLLIFTPSNNS